MPLKVISNLALTQQEAINEYSIFGSLFLGSKVYSLQHKTIEKDTKRGIIFKTGLLERITRGRFVVNKDNMLDQR